MPLVPPPPPPQGLATRPLAGTAPRMPEGLTPRTVAERVVVAIEGDEALVTADAF